jgi:hypothetical protein
MELNSNIVIFLEFFYVSVAISRNFVKIIRCPFLPVEVGIKGRMRSSWKHYMVPDLESQKVTDPVPDL